MSSYLHCKRHDLRTNRLQFLVTLINLTASRSVYSDISVLPQDTEQMGMTRLTAPQLNSRMTN